MQVCGYPLKWDLQSCWGLKTKKNEKKKKNYSNSLEGSSLEKMSYVGGEIDW